MTKSLREHYDQWVQTRRLPYYDKLAAQLKARPFDQVAYDLVNECRRRREDVLIPAVGKCSGWCGVDRQGKG
jgi:hypothetical protein